MKSRNNGFTTIELTIVMIIFAMVLSTVMFAFDLYNKQRPIDETNEALSTIKAALFEYKNTYGVYPCPADPTLVPGNPMYGREKRTAPWPDMNAACITQLPAVLGLDGDNADNDNNTATGQDNVLIGMIPFATLLDPDKDPSTDDGVFFAKLTEKMAADGWGRKFIYGVTENLTKASTYDDRNGAIDVIDENKLSILNPGRLAQAVVITTGADGRGAYPRNSNNASLCDLGVPANPALANETENCKNDDGIFMSGLNNDTLNSYNDDKVVYLYNENSSLWVAGTTDPFDLSKGYIKNTNSGNVGFGTSTPHERLEVEGNIDANRAEAAWYCDKNGGNCMEAKAIGGDGTNNAAMQCPPGQVVSAIEKNSVYDPGNGVNHCVPLFTGPVPDKMCLAGQYVYAISPLSGVLCGPKS